MTNFEHDDLPPDLSDLGRRMRDERPVAEDDALDRMMQRAQTPSRETPRRAPKRALAVSLTTMLAMVSVTGVAAAALFGMSFPLLGHALTSSSQRVGTSSTQALRAPAATSAAPAATSSAPATTSASRISAITSPAAGLGSLAGIGAGIGGATPGTAAVLPARLIPGNLLNAGFFQYGPGRLVCRILRALGLNRIARLLGCP
jgi:hypothetical protein